MLPLRITLIVFLISSPALSEPTHPEPTHPGVLLSQNDPAAILAAAESILADSPSPETLTSIKNRIATLFESARPPQIDHVPALAAACKLALLLHRADPGFALSSLQEHTPDCLAAANISGTAGDRFLTYAATFCQLRFESGKDPAALDDYIALLPTADPDAFTQLPALLHFLFTYPDNPKLAAFADSLLNKSDGEWNPIVGLNNRFYAGYTARDLYRDPLLWKLPAFRTQLLRLLSDTDPVGELTIIDSNSFAISITKGWTDSITDIAYEGHLPDPGTRIPLRLCDFHALFASRQPGAPAFQPTWTIEKRDAALTHLRTHFK